MPIMSARTQENFFEQLGAASRAAREARGDGEAPPTRPFIMVATDFSATSDKAIDAATHLAARVGARLEVVHVLSLAPIAHAELVWVPTPGQMDRMSTEAQTSLDEAVARARKLQPETEIGGSLRAGMLPDALLDAIEVESPDLVVMGTHGRGFWSRLVMGSVAHAVNRRSSAPVLTVHDEGIAPKAESVLAPVELGRISEEALDLAAGLAKALRLKLRLLYVFPGADAFDAIGATYDPPIAKASQAQLESLAGPERRADIEVESVTRFGAAAKEIAVEADESNAALVVMGTQRRGIVSRAIEGSVADDVLRLCPRPVILCRERTPGQ